MVVVGAGIAGLAGAYEARKLADAAGLPLEITILESEPRAGGKIFTERIDGLPFEWGPDSFVASKPAARELATELGLDLLAPAPQAERAYVLSERVLRPFPAGLVMGVPRGPAHAFRAVRSGLVGIGAALRASVEPLVPGGVPDGDVGGVVGRRLGPRWARRLVLPLVEGVFGAPADGLGMHAALPQFAGSRSLVLAARRQPRPGGHPFLSVRGGMGAFVERLLPKLSGDDLRLRTPALRIEQRDGGLAVVVPDEEIAAEAVLVAVPAPQAAPLLQAVAPRAAEDLSTIRFSSSAVVALRYTRGAIGRTLDGAGYLVPREEGLVHAACSWFSAKWPEATDDVWLRAIVTSPARLREDDRAIGDLVAREVGSVMHATSDPTEVLVHRWEPALPVYGPRHVERVERIEGALPRGIAVAGTSYRGLGVPDCIASGRAAAARLIEDLLA